MRLYMQDVYGTSGEIIFLDHAGFSTYGTMYRAKEIFEVENAIVVTQKFHLSRIKTFFLVLFKAKPTYLGQKKSP